MSYTDTFIGKAKPLRIYANIDVIDFTFTVLNNDESAYDFTGWTDINLKIYNHRGGTLLETLVKTVNLTISSNVITLNIDWSEDMAAEIDTTDLLYYDLIFLDSSSRSIMISFGDFKVI